MLLQSISWQEFVRNDGPKLFRYFAARFDRATAADLVQETLIRLVQKVESGVFRVSDGELIAYAYGIAHYVAMECYKSQKMNQSHQLLTHEMPETAVTTATQNELEDQSSAIQLRSAISQLTEQEQQIILLLIDQDLTLQQIALIVDMPLNTVKSHMHRAKRQLKIILTNQNLTQEDLL